VRREFLGRRVAESAAATHARTIAGAGKTAFVVGSSPASPCHATHTPPAPSVTRPTRRQLRVPARGWTARGAGIALDKPRALCRMSIEILDITVASVLSHLLLEVP